MNAEVTETPTYNNMKTPVNKKTKKKRLKKCLKSASKSNLSFSFLNSSAVKQSLRANNRALALNLQRCRHELKMVTQENVELQKTIKELEMRVLTLERVAGLKDAEIETEVERRLQETAMAMVESEVQLAVNETYRKLKDMLVKAGQSLYEASSSITQALNECIETPRRSTISSFRSFRRGTSICSMGSVRPSISEDDMRSPSTARLSSQAIHVPESDLPLQAQPPEGVEFQSHDISIIMEQPSMITDGMEQYLPDKLGDIDSVPEETTEDEAASLSSKNKNQKKALSKLPLPQRVPRKGKDTELAMETARSNVGSSDRDFPILASKSDSVLVIDKDSQSTEEDRRKTFLVPSQPQKSPTSQSKDRRGTFLVEKNLEKEENLPSASQIDRRGTFILPQKSQECTILPEVTFPEGSEHTMIFNTDMEMTEVLDPVRPISCNVSPVTTKDSVSVERVSLDNREVRHKLEELKKKTQKENEDKEKDPNTENDNGNSNKKTGHDASDNTAKSAVECRVTKPGKIVFSATRKDLDGFRKPVPVKKPKSKSTVKLSKGGKSLKGQTTPVKPVSVFDFHDKTPNVNAGKAPDVYNISMDEPVVTDSSKKLVNEPAERDKQESSNNRKSRSRTRERKDESSDGSSQRGSPEKSQSRKSKEPHTRQEAPELVDGMIYHLPLKGCTPEKPVSNTRGRSRSRGRKSYKDFFDESDVESPSTDANKRSRSRSKKRKDDDADFTVTNRGRSKSKGPVSNNDDSEEKLNTKRSKSRARSRTRMAEEDSGNASVEIATAEKNTVNENGNGNEEAIHSPEIKIRSRSRGRSTAKKGTQIAESESQRDEDVELQARNSRSSNNRAVSEREESPEVRSRAKSRGRSRSRKTTQKVDQQVMENQDRNEVPVRNLRSKSRTRSKVQSSSEEGDEKDEEREVKRSRGHVEEIIRSPRETRKSVRRSKSRTSVADDIENEKSDKEVENLVVPDSDESMHLIEDEAAPNMVLPSSDENIDVSEKNVGSRRKSLSKRKSVCLNDSDECIDLENLRKSVNRLNRSTDSDNFVKQSTLESLEFQNPALSKKPQSSRKRKKIEDKEECSKKVGVIIKDKETTSTDGSAMDRLGMISVRDRTKEAPFINDEELTFSDFDKMYQAKRTQSDYEKAKQAQENVEKNKHNRMEVEDIVQRTSKSTKKRKLASSNNKICETPKSKTVLPTVLTGKAKSRGSSKKKKDNHRVDDVSQSTEKENKGPSSTEMSVVDKLKLIKEKITMTVGKVDKDKAEENQGSCVTTGDPKVLNDVGNQMSEQNTPVVKQRTEFEPSAKRSSRGVKKDYKEASLNMKMRREDFTK